MLPDQCAGHHIWSKGMKEIPQEGETLRLILEKVKSARQGKKGHRHGGQREGGAQGKGRSPG